MGMLDEFKEFALKGNVMDLAVGVIIGGAFGKIVTSVVDDLLMPVINHFIMPGGDWQKAEFHSMKVGSFAGSVINFFIIAACIFFIVKLMNNMMKKEAPAPAPPAGPSSTDKLLMEIRDSLKK
jgi:large conductance mechanosensitive channel